METNVQPFNEFIEEAKDKRDEVMETLETEAAEVQQKLST